MEKDTKPSFMFREAPILFKGVVMRGSDVTYFAFVFLSRSVTYHCNTKMFLQPVPMTALKRSEPVALFSHVCKQSLESSL